MVASFFTASIRSRFILLINALFSFSSSEPTIERIRQTKEMLIQRLQLFHEESITRIQVYLTQTEQWLDQQVKLPDLFSNRSLWDSQDAEEEVEAMKRTINDIQNRVQAISPFSQAT